jgi:asparagine synthetase B (glutamine-hydrolysing)
MDNLFAVIVPNKNSTQANIIINSQLSKVIDNSSSNVFSETSNQSNTIYLMKYSTEQADLGNITSSTKNHLKTPIIGTTRVDNKDDLPDFCELEVNNETLLNDEQVLLSAYKKFGTDSFSKIKGNFQTIFWDEQSQHLCAALDAFSSRSLFYVKIFDALYIASDAKTLASITNISLTVNKLAVSQWLAGRPDPNSSMFNEISRLPAGHCLEYSDILGVKITKFWDIDPNFSVAYNNTEDYKAHFFELLQSSVAKRLAVTQFSEKTAVFCQMSGGMDSTSVTAIAKQLLDKENLPLHTLSHRYQNTKSCDESTNIKDMISTLGLANQHYIELDQFESGSFAQLYPTDFDNPGVVLSPKYHQELALMKHLGASVLLTGNGGDETCWGHSASYRSRLYKGEIGVISEVIDACSQLNEPVVRSLYKLFMPSSVQNMIKLARKKPNNTNECPPWLLPQAFDLVMDENRLFINPFSATFDPARHARYHGLKSTSTYNSMRSYQKAASGYGIDVRHPFFDTELVEFSFAIPEKLLIQGVYPKWLLRHTMQEHLPHSVCWNKHKVVFDHHFANLVRNNQVELRKLLSHEGLQELGLVDNRILLREFDAVVNNPNGHLNVDMLYAILTQLWFQTHCLNNKGTL